jgi:aspartyl-tRNA(Asn)/glutamyl-tRNA(Gln) amidotransferase subunit A
MLGTYVLSAGYADAYYEKALALREQIRQKLKEVFTEYDFIATPTSPVPPFLIGEKSKDPVAMYLADIFTVTANIAGLPAISMPAGNIKIEDKQLPVGVQFMAAATKDEQLLDFANSLETNQE